MKKILYIILLTPFCAFSQIADTCDVGFEFIVNAESRNVKFAEKENAEVTITSFHWDFGDGSTSSTSYPSHVYSQAGTYIVCLTYITLNNCQGTFCDTVIVEALPSIIYNLSGIVVTNTSVLPSGFALLIQKNGAEYEYQGVSLVHDGYYHFPDIDPGEYYVQIIPMFNIPGYFYPFYLPTYSGNQVLWQQAQPVYVYSYNTTQNIQLCSYNGIITGNQLVHGKIQCHPGAPYEDYLFNMDWVQHTPIANPGDYAINMPVLLYNEAGICIKATLSDFAGEFRFENIPYGKYFLAAEKAGVASAMIPVSLQTTADSQQWQYISLGSGGFSGHSSLALSESLCGYPNPARDRVRFSEPLPVHCCLTDVTGAVLKSFPKGTQEIDLLPFAPGTYFLQGDAGGALLLIRE